MQVTSHTAPQEGVLSSLSRVGQRRGLVSLTERLSDLTDWLGADFAAVQEELVSSVAGAVNEAPRDGRNLAERAAEHLLALPGKRVRPLCVMLAARLGKGADASAVRSVAVAAELVHAATLLHDDVIDQGAERRGAPAARMVYGNAASVLGGDHLLLRALRMVRSVRQPELLDTLLTTIDQMVGAEAIQLERRGRLDASRETYLAVIRGKTAVLFRWGLRAGGLLGQLDRDSIAALEAAGLALGTSFQLIDDVLDLQGDPTVTGKSALADLREGKITWPFIIACERDPGLREQIAASLLSGGDDPEQLRALVERVVEVGGIEATRAFAFAQRDEGERALEALAPGPAQQALRWVVRYSVERAA